MSKIEIFVMELKIKLISFQVNTPSFKTYELNFTMIKFIYARFRFYIYFNLKSIKHTLIPTENMYVTFLAKILKIPKCEDIYISLFKLYV